MRSYRALRSRLRSSDVLGRIGGDEFAALVLHVDEAAALQVAEEMREAVAQRGVASWRGERAREPPDRERAASRRCTVDDPRDVDALIDLADQRMYLAKRATKAANRVGRARRRRRTRRRSGGARRARRCRRPGRSAARRGR